MKELKGGFLSMIGNYIDRGDPFEFKHIGFILKNLHYIPWEIPKEKQQTISLLKKLKVQYTNNELSFNEKFKSINKSLKYIRLRNECQDYKMMKKLENFHKIFSPYIKAFYRKEILIKSDIFIEIEGALQQLEHLKHLKPNDLIVMHNVLDFDFHKNYKEIIYIYSCFDKIASIFHFFERKDEKFDFVSFVENMRIDNIPFYNGNSKLLEKADSFIQKTLFQDFKKLRHYITHKHTDPEILERYTNFYVYVGMYLLIFFIDEIINSYKYSNPEF